MKIHFIHITIISLICISCTSLRYEKPANSEAIIDARVESCQPSSPKVITLSSGHLGREGEEVLCYDNGTLKSVGFWKNDKFVGIKTYHKNGTQSSEEKLSNGQFTGLRTWWFENGHKRFQAHYNNKGLKIGIETWWYENGKKKSECRFNNGKKVFGSYKEWDSQGNLIKGH